VFQIGGNTFYDWKNKNLMKIPKFKRSGIVLIVEFCGIPRGFLNQEQQPATGNAHKWLVQWWRWVGVFGGNGGAQWLL
jgi:hypothetical protein